MLGKRIEIEILSDTMELEQVESFIRDLFCRYALPDDVFCKVLVCVNEAVINSIMHGNKYDGNKKVKIQVFTVGDHLYFRIADEGEGFNFRELPDPTASENLLKESGRGLYIIQNISEDIVFSEKGNIIEFKIRLSGED